MFRTQTCDRAAQADSSYRAGAPVTKDHIALMDVDTFLDVFGEPDVVARELRAKIDELTAAYNADNYEVRPPRPVDDWLQIEKKFVLASKVIGRRATQTLPHVGPPHRSVRPSAAAAGGDAAGLVTSEIHGILSTFDATLRRKSGEMKPTPLRREEILFQIKMKSNANNFVGYSLSATDESKPLLPRYDKFGFAYQAVEAARMFGSPEFAAFVREVDESFSAHRRSAESQVADSASARRAAAEVTEDPPAAADAGGDDEDSQSQSIDEAAGEESSPASEGEAPAKRRRVARE